PPFLIKRRRCSASAMAKRRRVRGLFLSIDRDPSSGTDFAQPMHSIGVLLKNGGQRPPMTTFSHTGRREVSGRGEVRAAGWFEGSDRHSGRSTASSYSRLNLAINSAAGKILPTLPTP